MMATIRGVLLAGGFRTQHELNRMPLEDQRNTLIVELTNRTRQSNYQSFDNEALAGAGALLVLLRQARIRDDRGLATMSGDDMRNTLIVELGVQLPHMAARLQGFGNIDLVLLALGYEDAGVSLRQPTWLRGVLLAGGFRSQSELNQMSSEDQRNTLIVELAGRTRQADYQSFNDYALAGAGAALVFLRHGRIRDDAPLQTMSADDLRNTLIVELAEQTGLGVPRLQTLSSIDLVRLGLGVDPSLVLFTLPGALQPLPRKRLQFRLRGFIQFQSTDDLLQGARDEVYISAIGQDTSVLFAGSDREVVVEHVESPIIGDVGDDTVRGPWSLTPHVLVEFDLERPGPYPRWYVVELLVVEKDNADVGDAFNEVKQKVRDKIQDVVRSAVSTAVSSGAGAAIGGALGAGAGALAGLAVGELLSVISEGLANEVFTPKVLRTGLAKAIDNEIPQGFDVPDWIEIRERGALYRIAYDWHVEYVPA